MCFVCCNAYAISPEPARMNECRNTIYYRIDVFHYANYAWSTTNECGKWLTSFMLCAMSTCLMIMLCSIFFSLCLFISLSRLLFIILFISMLFGVIVFYWVLRCARLLARARAFLLFTAIMFILRLLVHKLQWPSGTNKKKQQNDLQSTGR